MVDAVERFLETVADLCGGGLICMEADDAREVARALSLSPDRLREAAQAAFEVTQDAPELNMSNYDHDQVALLNTAMCEVFSILRDALFARAALATPNAQRSE